MPIIIHLFSFLNKKNLETTILLQGLITGDERIELPLKVLETSVIPFDQSPLYTFKTAHTLHPCFLLRYPPYRLFAVTQSLRLFRAFCSANVCPNSLRLPDASILRLPSLFQPLLSFLVKPSTD